MLSPTPKIVCESPTGYNAEEVYLSARLVIVCEEKIPSVPAPLIAAGLRTVPTLGDHQETSDQNLVIIPNVASAASSAAALVVDTTCRTNHPNVFACGGCAAFTIQPALKQKPSGSRPSSRAGQSSSRPNSRQSTHRRGGSWRNKTVETVLLSHLTSTENIREMAK